MTDHRPPRQDAALGGVGQLLACAAAGVAAAVIAPALLAGTALACALRRARLRFTWALPATAVLAIPLIVARGHTLRGVVRWRTTRNMCASALSRSWPACGSRGWCWRVR